MGQAELDAASYNLESKLEEEQNGLEKLWNTFSGEKESQPDLDFSMNDNAVHFIKETKPKKTRNTVYSSAKVKARNLLRNVGYRRFKVTDFSNLNFIVDVLSFLLQNFNPINIDRNVDSEDEQLMISYLWEVCVPHDFVAEVYTTPNYQIVAHPKLTFQKANQIVIKWFNSYENKNEVCMKIRDNFKSIHYIYSSLYPKIYNRINQFGIKNKSEFELAFSYYKVHKKTNDNRFKQTEVISFFSRKNPDAYQKERKETHEFEQQPEKSETWSLKVKPKSPILPTVRGKAKEMTDRQLRLHKTDLKRRLDLNTEKMEAIKKIKKNIVKKNVVLK